MPDQNLMSPEFHATVASLRELISRAGLTISDEVEVAYGYQLKIVKEDGSRAAVTIYAGKKGISKVVTGSPGSLAYRQLKGLVTEPEQIKPVPLPPHLGGSLPVSGVPFGFEETPEFDYRWIGTDESGKGDYFGPLVAAGMYVDDAIAKQLAAWGVKDSKQLTDKANCRLAEAIRTHFPDAYEIIEILPERYNLLYTQFHQEGKNLNALLAWGHARALENLLKRHPCRYALADKFADENYIKRRLFDASRQITLIQRPKAEQNCAVAAASILARSRFLTVMEKLGKRYGLTFAKGASVQVEKQAREFVIKYGRDELAKVAKLHFKTTAKVILPD